MEFAPEVMFSYQRPINQRTGSSGENGISNALPTAAAYMLDWSINSVRCTAGVEWFVKRMQHLRVLRMTCLSEAAMENFMGIVFEDPSVFSKLSSLDICISNSSSHSDVCSSVFLVKLLSQVCNLSFLIFDVC